MKSPAVARNIVGHLKKTKASLIAVQLMEKLLPLFAAVRLMGEPKPRGQAGAGRGQLPTRTRVLLCFSLPGLRRAERALHQPLQRPNEDCGEEKQEAGEDKSGNGLVPSHLSHERPNPQRGQGTDSKAKQ